MNKTLRWFVSYIKNKRAIKRLKNVNKEFDKKLKNYIIQYKQLLEFYKECLQKTPDDINLKNKYNRIKKILDKIESDIKNKKTI